MAKSIYGVDCVKKYLPADQFYKVSGRRYADACKFHKRELSKKYYAKNKIKMRAKGVIKRRIRDVDEVNNVIVIEKREVSDDFVKKTIQAQNKFLIRR